MSNMAFNHGSRVVSFVSAMIEISSRHKEAHTWPEPFFLIGRKRKKCLGFLLSNVLVSKRSKTPPCLAKREIYCPSPVWLPFLAFTFSGVVERGYNPGNPSIFRSKTRTATATMNTWNCFAGRVGEPLEPSKANSKAKANCNANCNA